MLLSPWLSAIGYWLSSELKLVVKQIKTDSCMTTTIYDIVTGMVTIRERTNIIKMVSNVSMNGTKTHKFNWHNSNCLDFTQTTRYECLECSFVNLPEPEMHIIRPVTSELLDHVLLMNVYLVWMNACLMNVTLLQPNVFT